MPWSELTSLGSLTIEDCGKLRALPRALGTLGALKQLTLKGLVELQEMPDLIGLTALDDSILRQAQGAAEGTRQAGGAQAARAWVVV
jgi:hypothetical protein